MKRSSKIGLAAGLGLLLGGDSVRYQINSDVDRDGNYQASQEGDVRCGDGLEVFGAGALGFSLLVGYRAISSRRRANRRVRNQMDAEEASYLCGMPWGE